MKDLGVDGRKYESAFINLRYQLYATPYSLSRQLKPSVYQPAIT